MKRNSILNLSIKELQLSLKLIFVFSMIFIIIVELIIGLEYFKILKIENILLIISRVSLSFVTAIIIFFIIHHYPKFIKRKNHARLISQA